jgi:tRNA modification GTPase
VNADSSPGADAIRLAYGADAGSAPILAAGFAGKMPALPTLVACLTPAGRGAIAALGIRGPRAWSIVREIFRPSSTSKKLPENSETSRIWLGRIGENSTGADQVVVTVQQTTPVPWVEIHCHGGTETVRWLMEILQNHGCHVCTWPGFEQATTTDAWKTAVSLELVQASTIRTAAILLDQYHGAFARALAKIQTALANHDLAETSRLLESLARYADAGRHLTTPWKIAVIGPPNVGKSSLVNALAGFQRSIVAPTPGTTRDLVTTLVALDGWPVELIDTAGLREETESLEGQGIHLARDAASGADLCLWLVDASAPPVWPDRELAENQKIKLIVNKIDLTAVWDVERFPGLRISARTGVGLPGLVEAMALWLVPNPPPPGTPVPFTRALAIFAEEALTNARAGRINELAQALSELAKSGCQELIVEPLQKADTKKA